MSTTQGTLAIVAGRGLALQGGQVTSGGAQAVAAGRDANLDATAPALRAQGNVQIQVGQDVNARALQNVSDTATLCVAAVRGVNLLATITTTTTVGSGGNSRTSVPGSSLSGTNVVVSAGTVAITAGNNINLTTTTEIVRSKTQRDANNWKREFTATGVGIADRTSASKPASRTMRWSSPLRAPVARSRARRPRSPTTR